MTMSTENTEKLPALSSDLDPQESHEDSASSVDKDTIAVSEDQDSLNLDLPEMTTPEEDAKSPLAEVASKGKETGKLVAYKTKLSSQFDDDPSAFEVSVEKAVRANRSAQLKVVADIYHENGLIKSSSVKSLQKHLKEEEDKQFEPLVATNTDDVSTLIARINRLEEEAEYKKQAREAGYVFGLLCSQNKISKKEMVRIMETEEYHDSMYHPDIVKLNPKSRAKRAFQDMTTTMMKARDNGVVGASVPNKNTSIASNTGRVEQVDPLTFNPKKQTSDQYIDRLLGVDK